MDSSKTLYAADREEWRAWLAAHYTSESEIWLIFYKKHSGRQSVPYDDAVEEALCFGWIDSIIKRGDDDYYLQKFTPRKNANNWSPSNKRRVVRMIAAGRMTEAGVAKVTFPLEEGIPLDEGSQPAAPRPRQELPIPDAVLCVLQSDPAAWENFNRLAPSYRRQYVGWITSAKREETQVRRALEAVELLRENKKLGMR